MSGQLFWRHFGVSRIRTRAARRGTAGSDGSDEVQMSDQGYSGSSALPDVVVAADWSTVETKRWMVRGERVGDGYVVYPPEPVGDHKTLIARLRRPLPENHSLLIGFDFPIGLPVGYAQTASVTSFRTFLGELVGRGEWERFYEISDSPSLHQPFFPLPKQQSGNFRAQLAQALGFADLSVLRRSCERKTATRKSAECLFFTLGGAQVGAGAIVGWRDVIQPALAEVKLWPFDGELLTLTATPGVTVAEIYPAEAYSHLGVSIGSGTGSTKTSRKSRQRATSHWLVDFDAGPIRLSDAARSWVEWGFLSEDDFDAMAGLLSMLLIVIMQRSCEAPSTSDVRQIEGWILGQTC